MLRYGDALFFYDRKSLYRKIMAFFFRGVYLHIGIYISTNKILEVTFVKFKQGYRIREFNKKEKFHIYRFKVKSWNKVIETNLKKVKGYSIWLFLFLPFMWIAKMTGLKLFENKHYVTCIEFFTNCLKDAKPILKKGFKHIVGSVSRPDDLILTYENELIKF